MTESFANLPDIPSSLLAPNQDARRRELLEARVRVAEGFARLHEAGRAQPEQEPQT